MKRLVRLATRRPAVGELEDEFAFHLDMRTQELIQQGWEPGAARVEALRLFGDLEAARAYCRERDLRRGERHMRAELLQELRQDLGYAVRALRRSPGFALVAALTLALGIGANTAIFSVVRGILLRPLPFQEPDRLVAVLATYDGNPSSYVSPANLVDWQDRNRSFSSFSILEQHGVVLTGAGDPELLSGYDVSAGYFDMLGVRPVAGRLGFTEAEAAWQGPKVVILNEAVWRNRFGGDPAVVGRMITLDDQRYEVVGVAPSASAWPAGTMLWFPFTYDPAQLAGSRGAVYLNAIARLRPGATVTSAADDMRAVAAALEREYPVNLAVGATVVPLQEELTEGFDQPLYILLGGVGFVLLIACSNVAGLLLVRGLAREAELAVRTALGAGRGRLVRQLVTESLVLALLGGAAGLALAAAGVRLLLRIAPPSIPRLDAIHIDPQVLAFTILVAVLTGLLFGFLPARVVLRSDVSGTLREAGRGGQQPGANLRARRLLVAVQLALSVMLLAGAGLLIRSFSRLMQVDPGFRTSGTVAFGLSLPDAKYSTREQQAAFVRDLLDQIQAVPGVQSAAVGLGTPLTGFSFNFSFAIEGRPAPAPEDQPSAQVRVASAEYFTTMAIPITRGRGFTPGDRAGGPKVLVLTESGAREFFPGEDPIGQRVRIAWGGAGNQLEGEIVGVVGDIKQVSLARAPRPQFWAVYDQRPVSSFDVVIHSARDLQSVVADARQVVHRIDPNLAISQVRTLVEIVSDSVAQPRFYMILLSLFAAVAIGLSGIGIYGVIAYLVGQRSREIGIRLALGATRRRVVGMVVHEAVAMASLGVVLGLAGAFGLSRVLQSLLFDVSPTDPVTYLAVILVLGLVALAACSVPAARAANLDPALTMKSE